MAVSVMESEFTCKLVTIHSEKSFADVTGAIEAMFQMADMDHLSSLAAAGDAQGIKDYFQEIGGTVEFAIFFMQDQGSTARLDGIPIESRFYLFGNAIIAHGLFQYAAMAGLGAPVRFCVSQRDGEQTRIDIDQPSAFFSQFPEMEEATVPQMLDEKMIRLLKQAAS